MRVKIIVALIILTGLIYLCCKDRKADSVKVDVTEAVDTTQVDSVTIVDTLAISK